MGERKRWGRGEGGRRGKDGGGREGEEGGREDREGGREGGRWQIVTNHTGCGVCCCN